MDSHSCNQKWKQSYALNQKANIEAHKIHRVDRADQGIAREGEARKLGRREYGGASKALFATI